MYFKWNFTYASFKNVSALIRSISPPRGSLSYFFIPNVSRPDDKKASYMYNQSSLKVIVFMEHIVHDLIPTVTPLPHQNLVLQFLLPWTACKITSRVPPGSMSEVALL